MANSPGTGSSSTRWPISYVRNQATLCEILAAIPRDYVIFWGRLRKRKKSYAKHRKETRDGQARYGRGSCLPIAQLPLTRNSVSVPAAINTAASPKPTTGETAVHTTPTEALEMNLAAPLTVPSAP